MTRKSRKAMPIARLWRWHGSWWLTSWRSTVDSANFRWWRRTASLPIAARGTRRSSSERVRRAFALLTKTYHGSRLTGQVVLKSSMWITSGWPWTRAQPSNEQQLECAGLEKDRETGRCLTNGIPLDCARSGDYFDHLDEPTGCRVFS